MKGLISVILMASAWSVSSPKRLEILFFDAQDKLVYTLKQDDFEIWHDPEYLALRIDKENVQEIAQVDNNIANGFCRIVNSKGDLMTIKILDGSMSQKAEQCVYMWATEDGLEMLAGVVIIGNVREEKYCKERVDQLASFLDAR